MKDKIKLVLFQQKDEQHLSHETIHDLLLIRLGYKAKKNSRATIAKKFFWSVDFIEKGEGQSTHVNKHLIQSTV